MKGIMEDRQLQVGVWFYGLGTVLTGILNIAWGAFDASHQPIQALGKNLPGQQILAYVAGVWLVAAGFAILWRRSAKIGAAASAVVYLIFAALWVCRYYAGIHALGWRIDVILGVTFGLAQQLMLVAPAAIVYASVTSPDSLLEKESSYCRTLDARIASCPLRHISSHRYSRLRDNRPALDVVWLCLGGLTGIAFILAGIAICAGIKDVLAARLLALMLLLFEGFVEIPPIFIRLHDLRTWGAAVYNLSAIGACWIFAEFLASRADRGRIGIARTVGTSRPDQAVA